MVICSPSFPALAKANLGKIPVAFRRTTSSQSRGRLWNQMACFIINHIPSLRHDAWHQSHLKYRFKCSHNMMIEVNQLRRRLAYLRQIVIELHNRSISSLSRGKPKRIKSGHSRYIRVQIPVFARCVCKDKASTSRIV